MVTLGYDSINGRSEDLEAAKRVLSSCGIDFVVDQTMTDIPHGVAVYTQFNCFEGMRAIEGFAFHNKKSK